MNWSKIKWVEGRSYCGYLTPVEIFELVDLGARFTLHENVVQRAISDKAEGKSNARWVYFTPNKNLDSLLRKYKNRLGKVFGVIRAI